MDLATQRIPLGVRKVSASNLSGTGARIISGARNEPPSLVLWTFVLGSYLQCHRDHTAQQQKMIRSIALLRIIQYISEKMRN